MQRWTIAPKEPIQITFLLFDQFSNHCLANCLEPLRACNSFTTAPVFQWRFLTIDGSSVQSSSDLPILPDGALSDMQRCDYLFITSSYEHIRHDTAKTRIALQKAAKLARIVVGLDTGAWLMAAAGLLVGKQATIHWDTLDSFEEAFPSVNVQRQNIVQTKNRITCAGAMSAFDLLLLIISSELGSSFKVDVEAFFVHQDTPNVSPLPDQSIRSPLLNRALSMMHANVELPLSRDALAKSLSCPAKTLDRRCLAEFGAPAGQIYRHIRLSTAQKMITTTPLSILEVSLRCGFQNASAMTRAYKSRFGVTPTQNRKTTLGTQY